jgi:peptidoglycan/xylan/chitin deacetylase (PgdA/CDA1 family)
MKGKRELMARALNAVMLRPLRQLVGRPGLLCLTYHRVADAHADGLDDGLISASVKEFEWQVRWLRDNVRVLGGDEILQLVRGELRLREPAVAITFDDGYADNLAAGELLMERFGVPAIFFITTGFVGTTHIPHWDRLAFSVKGTSRPSIELAARFGSGSFDLNGASRDGIIRELVRRWRSTAHAEQEAFVREVEEKTAVAAEAASRSRPVFLTWDEVKRLKTLGHTIGAHTHSHPILASVSGDEQRRELTLSKELLEEKLGTPIRLLAYPNGLNGAYSDETKVIARECGFAAAFSFHGGTIPANGFDAFDLKRAHVATSESRELFQARVSFPQLLARESDARV